MQHDGCECGRISSGVLAGTPKTEAIAGTMNVGTNRVGIARELLCTRLQAHAEVEISFSPLGVGGSSASPALATRVSCVVEMR